MRSPTRIICIIPKNMSQICPNVLEVFDHANTDTDIHTHMHTHRQTVRSTYSIMILKGNTQLRLYLMVETVLNRGHSIQQIDMFLFCMA